MSKDAGLRIGWVLLLLTLTPELWADVKSKAAREAAEYVLRKFGQEAAKESAETLSGRIERLAVRYGDEAMVAIRKGGPQAVHVLEAAGEHGEVAVRLLAKRGDEALFLVTDPAQLRLVSRYGDDAADVMIRLKGIAQPLISTHAQPGIKAMQSLSSQNARRLAMLHAEGELSRIGRTQELLDVVSKYGDKAMDFIWRNKGALLVSTTLAAFLANPQPFLDGTRQLTENVSSHAMDKLAESPGLELPIVGVRWNGLSIGMIVVGTALVLPTLFYAANLRSRLRAMLGWLELSRSR